MLSRVMIVCPVTERPVPTKFEVIPARTFRKDLAESGSLACVACGRRHSWYRPETFLEGEPEPGFRRRAGDTTHAIRAGWVMRHVEIGRR